MFSFNTLQYFCLRTMLSKTGNKPWGLLSVCSDSLLCRLLMLLYVFLKSYIEQECIRVGCVPPASVAILWGVSSQGVGVSD